MHRLKYAFTVAVLAIFVGAIIDMFAEPNLHWLILHPLYFCFWLFIGYVFHEKLTKWIKQ